MLFARLHYLREFSRIICVENDAIGDENGGIDWAQDILRRTRTGTLGHGRIEVGKVLRESIRFSHRFEDFFSVVDFLFPALSFIKSFIFIFVLRFSDRWP